MKKLSVRLFLVAVGIFAIHSLSYAQFRDQLPSKYDYTGAVIKKDDHVGSWANLFNMKMSQSYSMTFSSIGGQYQNINMFTNTMQFMFSDKLTGRLDVSLMHSPFGGSFSNNLYGNNIGAKIFIRNAELNYQLGPNSHITVQFQQHPYSMMNPWSGYYGNPYSNSIFMR